MLYLNASRIFRDRRLFVVAGGVALSLLTAGARAEGDAEKPMQPPDSAAVRAATDAKVQALGQELAQTAKEYGGDAVALQSLLLIESMRAGAVGATEVRVAGPSSREGLEFLEIVVDTGFVFDRDKETAGASEERIWSEIVVPVLSKMEHFDIRPAGLDLVFHYATQRFSASVERKADLSAPLDTETIRFVLDSKVLASIAAGSLDIEAARPVVRRVLVAEPPVGTDSDQAGRP